MLSRKKTKSNQCQGEPHVRPLIETEIKPMSDGEEVNHEPGAFHKRGHFLSPERAAHTSPGQRPGKLLKKILSPVRALHK